MKGDFRKLCQRTDPSPSTRSICHSREALLSSTALKSGGASPLAAVGARGGLTRGAALPVTPDNGWDINAAGTVHIWGYHMAAEQVWQEFPTISLLQASAPATEFGAEVFQHTHLSSNFFSFEIIKSTLQNILFGMILKNSKQSKLLSFFKKNRLNSLIPANNIWDFRVWIYFFITAELWTPKSEV